MDLENGLWLNFAFSNRMFNFNNSIHGSHRPLNKCRQWLIGSRTYSSVAFRSLHCTTSSWPSHMITSTAPTNIIPI